MNKFRYIWIGFLCLALVSAAGRVTAFPANGSSATNSWEIFMAGIESDDLKKQFDVALEPTDGKVPPSIAARAVPRLIKLGQMYYSTNLFGTNALVKEAYIGFTVSGICQMGPSATNALPWLEQLLVAPDVSEGFKVQIFFSISSIAPNSEAEWRSISYCLHSHQDRLFDTGVERFSHVPLYLRSAEFIPLLTGLLQQGNLSPAQKAATIRALGYIGSAIKMIHQESNPKYRGDLRWNLDYNYNQILFPDDIKKIGDLLFDPDALVRKGAITELDELGTNAFPAKAELQRAKESGDSEMKVKADKILSHLAVYISQEIGDQAIIKTNN